MLSENMYAVLSCFPRDVGKEIRYEELVQKCTLSKEEIKECLNETLFSAWNYVRSSKGWYQGSLLYLTESGLAGVERYEDETNSKKTIKISLYISIVAMIAAEASAVASIISIFW